MNYKWNIYKSLIRAAVEICTLDQNVSIQVTVFERKILTGILGAIK